MKKVRPPRRAPAPLPRRNLSRPTLPARKKLLFSTSIVMAALVLLEGGARLLVRVTPSNSRWEYHRKVIDTAGFPALNGILVADPARFWALRPDLDRVVLTGRIASSSELAFTVSTGADGSRRVPAVSGERQTVAFLGDSCTFGVGVDEEQTFAALLQQTSPEVRAINLGVPGYSAFQGRVQLNQYRFPTPPAAVVIEFGFNDEAVWDNRGDLEHTAALEAGRSWVDSSRFITLLAGLLRRPGPAAPDPGQGRRPRLLDAEFIAEIRTIAAWCRARHAEPVLVLWPYRPQLSRNDMSPKQRALVRVATSDGLPLVNLIPFVRAQGGESLFLDIIHMSAKGHAVVARALDPVLRQVLAAATAGRR